MYPQLHRLWQRIRPVETRCTLCKRCFAPEHDNAQLCACCQSALKHHTEQRCLLCGLPTTTSSLPCPTCFAAPPPWQSLRYFGIYQGSLRELVIRHKHAPDITLGRLAGHLLCQALRTNPFTPQEHPELVIPVPLHPKRLGMRGFNQAFLLARYAGHMLHLPVCAKALQRVRHTPAQSGLPQKKRRTNLRNAFVATNSVRQKRILLVDDVMTSGATLEHCTFALHTAGASHVHALVLARTPLSSKMPSLLSI